MSGSNETKPRAQRRLERWFKRATAINTRASMRQLERALPKPKQPNERR